jgi:aspartate/tyrosine/aromatic aminotransferase
MYFEGLTPAPPDAILGLTDAFQNDSHPSKINLGVGVYKDERGRTPVLESVKAAEALLLKSEDTKGYLSIGGLPDYRHQVLELLFGETHAVVTEKRVRSAHTPGGTGGLRAGAELIKTRQPDATVHVSTPTWANHPGIFSAAGFQVATYPYYDAATKGLDFDGFCAALEAIPAGDVVVLHVCCHNPTGVDLTVDQWRQVGAIAARQGWLPFLDFAYQGFAEDLETDRAGLIEMAGQVPEMLVASSFSKNFGLYRERVGALTLMASSETAATAAYSHLEKVIRVLYSNPPAHGGLVVSTILSDAALKSLWIDEVATMRQRIKSVRSALVSGLERSGVDQDFSYIKAQRGMFSFSGLSDAQVAYLREQRSIYIVKGGRINVAGITQNNLDYLCKSIAEALRDA